MVDSRQMLRRRTALCGALCGSLLIALVLMATTSTAGLAPVPSGPATQYAARILNGLHLPADAEASAGEPSSEGASEESGVLASCARRYTGSIDARQFWTTTEAPEAVVAAIKSHLSTNATTAARQPSASACGLALPSPGHGVGPAELGIVAAQTKPGHTIVRADVIVTKPPRAPWLPSSAQTIAVTVTPVATAGSRPKPTFGPKSITERGQVQQVLQAIEQLRHPITLPNQLFMCPPLLQRTDVETQLTFAKHPGGPTVARLTIAPADCGAAPIRLSIPGQPAQSLTAVPRPLGAQPLLGTLDAILKAKLPNA